jgi:hypothetical protein
MVLQFKTCFLVQYRCCPVCRTVNLPQWSSGRFQIVLTEANLRQLLKTFGRYADQRLHCVLTFGTPHLFCRALRDPLFNSVLCDVSIRVCHIGLVAERSLKPIFSNELH